MTNRPNSDVSSPYGAPMGRYTGPNYLETCAGRLHLMRVRLNSGGYDAGGAYWGLGAPLYYFEHDGETEQVYGYVRGTTRDKAKAQVRETYPSARFYR